MSLRCERHAGLSSVNIDVDHCGDCRAAQDMANWRRKLDDVLPRAEVSLSAVAGVWLLLEGARALTVWR